ncbi:hypothetical protein DFP78_1299 [Photobacterium lutimaris]|nr:hypothetical protein DFP78_1299 [Photobacterium lutimaris]
MFSTHITNASSRFVTLGTFSINFDLCDYGDQAKSRGASLTT